MFLDEDGEFADKCNKEMVALEPVDDPADQLALRQMIEWHQEYTGSAKGQMVLDNWKGMISVSSSRLCPWRIATCWKHRR